MKIRKLISAAAACVVAAGALAVSAFAADSYVAGITFQSSSYQFRNNIAQSKLLVWDNDLQEAVDVEGATYTDATITGDGTYTVELNGIVDGGWNMLKLESNIDLAVTPVTFELVSVELNGAAVDFDASVAVMSEGAATASDDYSDWTFSLADTARIQLINVYDNLSAIPNDSYESVKVTFKVSGLDADTTPVADTAAPTEGGNKGGTPSPDTGVEGIAAVAGVAVLAAGAVLVSKKRK